ncbi:carbohydrate ABC transporter permease [Streptosporangiaceae bacterium NEAU-GS5]|nr:carbohydrate ABC transporter permease [Streptosporangiaceae bacterium NEAU-GS5]
MSVRNRRAITSQTILVGLLSIGGLAMLLPFVWMLTTSLSRQANSAMPRTPTFWPPDPSLFNYEVASVSLPVWRFYLNSVIVVGLTTTGYLFCSALTGYAFAKGRFPGKSFFFLAFLSTLLLPFETRMIPLYDLMSTLHWNNTYWSLITPFLAGGFGTFLMRQHISGLPDEIIHAARLDGAGEFRIFLRLVLPLCKPALAALAIINIIWRWNDLLWPLLVTSERDMYTVTQGLALSGRSTGIHTGVALATATMAILPVMIIYLLLQRQIIRGFAMSGMKG